MPIEVGIWRIDKGVQSVSFGDMGQEMQLQQIIADDISIIDPRLMVIGREVETAYGGRIDLLAIDADGNLSVIELKREKTSREVVSQILDYGSWVRSMTTEEIAGTFLEYQRRFQNLDSPKSINEALKERFANIPDDLNSSHRLIIVSGSLDPSTERIVTYLWEQYEVDINAVFFRVFEDDERQYLTRAWLKEPIEVSTETPARPGMKGEWNGEFYVSFGRSATRSWQDAKRYGFVSAGGGEWYVNTLRTLQPGNRIWVSIPGTGYVGVGEVVAPAKRYDEFCITQNGIRTPITQVTVQAPEMFDEKNGEHLVSVKWVKAVDLHGAVKERGFFGNQNTVAKPRAPKWHFTVERLKTLWGVA